MHGVPGIIGTIISVIMAALATPEEYGDGLTVLYPALGGKKPITNQQQAVNQLLAGLVTLGIALVGGAVTGLILKYIGKWQALDNEYRPGSTVIKLALNIGNVFTTQVGVIDALPKDAFFDDDLFFEVHPDEKAMVTTQHDGGVGQYSQDLQMKRVSISSGSYGSSYGDVSKKPM